MLRRSMIAAAALAARLVVAAGPAGASSGIGLHTNLHFAPPSTASGVASVEFRMDGSGWNASTHSVSLAAGSYSFYVVASGAGGVYKVTKVCSFTLKTRGTGQCNAGHVALAPTFTPTRFSAALLNRTNAMVANAKF